MDFLADILGALLTGAALESFGNRGLGPRARQRRVEEYARGQKVAIPVRWEDQPPLNIDGSPRAPLTRVPDMLNGRLALTCQSGSLVGARHWHSILGDFEPFWQRASSGLRRATVSVVEDNGHTAIRIPGTGFQASPVMVFTTSDFKIVLDCLDVRRD
ncbi:hypothetical protein BJ986_000055 [Phycicoccus badiiscoriae]|uniref:Uncharacterized protein n=1 Tax=Pedococcus badiiscoriae TaxID=642776 RepID=A0A852W911_9MICO|nr:hypothetical protein [Pedococcus badiiscoriae]NYG05568.1 hypothetical protein [Pedococcus badiiscoriae]